jgi:arylsulfatase A-like enzyme
MAEVYAGFSEYTDAQVGRIIDQLEESGELENTLIFYCADNGASGEGSPNGSVNEVKFFNGFPDEIKTISR